MGGAGPPSPLSGRRPAARPADGEEVRETQEAQAAKAAQTSQATAEGGIEAARNARASGALQLQLAADVERLARMSGQHDQMLAVLGCRARLAGHVSALWAAGRLDSLGAELRPADDPAALCDFLRALMRRRLLNSMDVGACQALLRVLRDLAANPREVFAATAFHTVELLLRHFGEGLADAAVEDCSVAELSAIHGLLLQSSILGRFGSLRVSLETFLQRCAP